VLPTQVKARELHGEEKKLYVGHYLQAKQSIQDGTANPYFCAGFVHTQEKEDFSDPQAGYTSGTLLEAGSDTTSSILYGFVQAMIPFPEVCSIVFANAEIDQRNRAFTNSLIR